MFGKFRNILRYQAAIVIAMMLCCGRLAAETPLRDEARRVSDSLLVAGVEQFTLGQEALADSLLREADGRDPENAAVKYYRGFLAVRDNNVPDALANFSAASRLDSTNIWYKIRLGQVQYATGRIQAADRTYESIGRIRPYDPEILVRRAEISMMFRKFDRADSLLDIVDRVAGPNEYTLTLRMNMHMRMEKYESILSDCDHLIQFKIGDAAALSECHAIKGDCYQRLGQFKKACAEYEEALSIKPDNAMVLNNYAYYLSCLGRSLAKSEQMSRAALEKEPENPTYLDTYGWILHKMKKYQEARLYFKKAILYGGKEHPEILLHYAATLDALGEKDLAEGYRQQAALKKK